MKASPYAQTPCSARRFVPFGQFVLAKFGGRWHGKPMSLLKVLRLSGPAVLGFALLGALWGAFAALAPAFKARLGVDDAGFGAVLLGSSLGLLAAMWLAPALDRRLRSWTLPVGALCLVLSWGLLPLASGAMSFALALCLTGLSSGVVDVVMNARVSDSEARVGRPLLNANHGVFSLCYGLAAIASGQARQAGVPPLLIFALIGLAALALLPALRVAPARSSEAAPQDSQEGPRRLGTLVHLCGLVVFLAFTFEAAVESWSALHLERSLGTSPAQSALGPGLLGLTMALGRFAGNGGEAAFGPRRVLVAGVLLSVAGGLTAAFASTSVLAYLGFAALGLGISVVGPMGIALAGRQSAAAQRVDAIARAAVMGFAGFFVAPAIMGWVSAASSLRMAFALMALLMLLALPLAFRITRKTSEFFTSTTKPD